MAFYHSIRSFDWLSQKLRDANLVPRHSRPQSPRSFWPVAGIESSGLVQHRKSAIHGLIVKSSKSDWLRIRNEYSAHAQKIGSRQSSRSLPQARRIVGSGDENGPQGTGLNNVCACAKIKSNFRANVMCGSFMFRE